MGCPTFLYMYNFAILDTISNTCILVHASIWQQIHVHHACIHIQSMCMYMYTCIPSFLLSLCSSQIGCMYEPPQRIPCRALYSHPGGLPRPHFPLTPSPLWAPHHMALGVPVHQLTLDTMAVYQTCTTYLGLYLHLSVEE